MNIDGFSVLRPSISNVPARDRARTPEDAAKQFEAVLVRQLVDTMTKDMFGSQLSGDEGPGWIKSQGDAQRDVLADVLTQRLVESGIFKVADLLQRKWASQGLVPREATTNLEGALPERVAPSIGINGEHP